MKKTIVCPTCGSKVKVDACETCKGRGVKLSHHKHDRRDPDLFGIARCDDCDGTGIKGGRVIVTI